MTIEMEVSWGHGGIRKSRWMTGGYPHDLWNHQKCRESAILSLFLPQQETQSISRNTVSVYFCESSANEGKKQTWTYHNLPICESSKVKFRDMDAAKEENARACRERDGKREGRIEYCKRCEGFRKPVICWKPVWMFQSPYVYDCLCMFQVLELSFCNQHGTWMLYMSKRLNGSGWIWMGWTQCKHDKR